MERKRFKSNKFLPKERLPTDFFQYDSDGEITKRNIYDALTDPDMLADRADRVLSLGNADLVAKVRKELQDKSKEFYN